MSAEIITKEDLIENNERLLISIKSLLFSAGTPNQKEWLKSSEVMQMLGIKATSLQTLRITRQLPFSKLGGTLYYAYADVIKVLNDNKRSTKK